MKPVFLAAALVAAFATAAGAEGRRGGRDHRHHHQRVENARWDRQGDGRWNRPAEIDRITGNIPGRSIRRIRQVAGFYGGTIEAWPDRGNGIYFLRDDDDWQPRDRTSVTLASKAKVVDVETEMQGNAFASRACAFESGVCIIRGGN